MVERAKIENGKKSQPQPLSRRSKILTTSAILFGNITFGCCLNSYPSTLNHMRSKYETEIDSISMVLSVNTVFYCIGAVLCGLVSKYGNRQLFVILSLFGLASAMSMTPFCPTKTIYFACGGVGGFFSGFYDSSQMVWIIEIWQHKAGPLIQAQHFFYAVGATIPALLIAQFLGNATESSTDDSIEPIESARIHIPFLIIGSMNLLASLIQLFLFIFYRYEAPPMYANENFELIDDAKNVPSAIQTDLSGNVSINQQQVQQKDDFTIMGVSRKKLKLISFTTMFLGAYQAMEVSTLQYIPTFARYSDLHMIESSSAYVLTALTTMYAIGRFIGIIIIFKVRPELIIIINFVLIITGNTILLIWASTSVTMFWLGCIILGTGFSTMFPSFCAFIEKYLVFTSSVATCIILSATVMSAMYPYIIGNIIEHHAVVLTYTNYASTGICVMAMVWGYNLTRNSVHRER